VAAELVCVLIVQQASAAALGHLTRAYMRDKENGAIREELMVSIDISEVAFLLENASEGI
jgi:hypothetical protein